MVDSWREVVLEWQGESAFIGSNPAGKIVQIGSMHDKSGMSPMELLLAGLAGCTGIDVANILVK